MADGREAIIRRFYEITWELCALLAQGDAADVDFAAALGQAVVEYELAKRKPPE